MTTIYYFRVFFRIKNHFTNPTLIEAGQQKTSKKNQKDSFGIFLKNMDIFFIDEKK